jgi:hypothetical protein
MLESLIGGALGAVARLAPEVMGHLDKKNERTHELAMQDKQAELIRVQQAGAQVAAQVQADSLYNTGALGALRDAIAAQAKPSGVPWVDALAGTVRPAVTYGLVLLYAGVKATGMVDLWTPDDMVLLAGVINFWFVNRAIEKAQR